MLIKSIALPEKNKYITYVFLILKLLPAKNHLTEFIATCITNYPLIFFLFISLFYLCLFVLCLSIGNMECPTQLRRALHYRPVDLSSYTEAALSISKF